MQHDRFNEDGFAFSSPVPPEQLPAKQYRDLKARRFFRWAVLNRLKFTTKLLAVWISSLLLAMLVVAARSANSSLAIDSYIARYVNCQFSCISYGSTALGCMARFVLPFNRPKDRLQNFEIQ